MSPKSFKKWFMDQLDLSMDAVAITNDVERHMERGEYHIAMPRLHDLMALLRGNCAALEPAAREAAARLRYATC